VRLRLDLLRLHQKPLRAKQMVSEARSSAL
jgi:hypothetical protein